MLACHLKGSEGADCEALLCNMLHIVLGKDMAESEEISVESLAKIHP